MSARENGGREVRALAAAVLRRAADPTVATALLTTVLAGVGAALASNAPGQGLLLPLTSHGAVFVVLTLAVTFFAAELGQALIEFRDQAYSFSLSGIPLLLGLLYCPPLYLIGARVLGALVAFAVQRAAPQKMAFNTALYLLDTALVITVSHRLLGSSAALDPRTAALCYLSLALVDLVVSGLVLLVIRIHDGPVSRADVREVLLPAAGFVALNTAVGFLCAVQLGAGALGSILLLLFVVFTTLVYRAYLVLRRRHQSLQVVQRFIEHSEGAGGVDELGGRLMDEIRTLVRAHAAELTLLDSQGNVDLRILSADDHGPVTLPGGGRRIGDRPYAAGLPDRAAVISRRSPDAAHRRWLSQHGVRDAAVVPVSRAESRGTLVAIDRLGDSATFTSDDLALLQALAGHLVVALRSTELLGRLRHDANHDALTGLANRTLLTERLQQAISEQRPDRTPAVLLLDLNRFKEVNDALGHHVGDQLLQVVATRLGQLDAPDATIARLGGDEFAVLLPGVTTEQDAVGVAERIATHLHAAVDLDEVTVSTEASIGVALAQPGSSHGDVLRHADTAMYAAKAAGTAVRAYSASLDAGRAERLALLADLHLALERDELDLHYQPKLDLGFGVVTSVEALVRWTHPTLGPIGPEVFIPLAESTGLIEQLTASVLGRALRQCREWQDTGLSLTVAVNLSARNLLNVRLPDQVAQALVAVGLPPQKLVLEITESSVMGDPDRTVPVLERLAAIGVALSLDDFGTGYSSLSYLQRLPVQEVKIDRSFVRGLTAGGAQHASGVLVRSIVNLGTSLGLRIVAEGVEDEETLEYLRELGCDLVQGYVVGRPVPGSELARTLADSGLRTTRAVA